MKKEAFLRELDLALMEAPLIERQDILRDQEEYIREAMNAGRAEETVIESLGSPKELAANLLIDTKIENAEQSSTFGKQIKNTFSAVFAILALAPLNLIFVLGPFLALVGLNLTGWGAAFAILVVTLVGIPVWFTKLIFVSAGLLSHLSSLFLIIGGIGVGVLSIILMYWLTLYFMRITIAYLKFNLGIIRGKV